MRAPDLVQQLARDHADIRPCKRKGRHGFDRATDVSLLCGFCKEAVGRFRPAVNEQQLRIPLSDRPTACTPREPLWRHRTSKRGLPMRFFLLPLLLVTAATSILSACAYVE